MESRLNRAGAELPRLRDSTLRSLAQLSALKRCNAWLDTIDQHASTQSDIDEAPDTPVLDGDVASSYLETASFVCVDIALENEEEAQKETKTVPKREIQLRRRNTIELPACPESRTVPSTQKPPRDHCLHQHSIPATTVGVSHAPLLDGDRKQKLWRSLSLDETSCKTKMASCHLKSVLLKKMNHENELQQEGVLCPSEIKAYPSDTVKPFVGQETPENLYLSIGLPVNSEKVNSSLTYNTNSKQSSKMDQKPLLPHSMKSPCKVSRGLSVVPKNPVEKLKVMSKLESKSCEKLESTNEEKDIVNNTLGARPSGDSAEVSIGSTATAPTQASGMQAGMTNKARDRQAKLENHKHDTQNAFIPEMSTQPSIIKAAVHKEEALERIPLDGTAMNVSQKHIVQEGLVEEPRTREKRNVTLPTHKVRDLRNLARNTTHTPLKSPAMQEQKKADKEGRLPLSFIHTRHSVPCKNKEPSTQLLQQRGMLKSKHELARSTSTCVTRPVSLILNEKANVKPQNGAGESTLPKLQKYPTREQKLSTEKSNQPVKSQDDPPLPPGKGDEIKSTNEFSPKLESPGAQVQYIPSPQSFVSLCSNDGLQSTTFCPVEGVSLTYEQNPCRMLLDPETGKYFFIKVPAQPMSKMLFDPETGQYVKVQMPQQASTYAGIYPTCTATYPLLHNPSVYALHFLPYPTYYYGGQIPATGQPSL